MARIPTKRFVSQVVPSRRKPGVSPGAITTSAGRFVGTPVLGRVHVGGKFLKVILPRHVFFAERDVDLLAPDNYWLMGSKRVDLDFWSKPYTGSGLLPYMARRTDDNIVVTLPLYPMPVYRKFYFQNVLTFATPILPPFPTSNSWLGFFGPDRVGNNELFLPPLAYPSFTATQSLQLVYKVAQNSDCNSTTEDVQYSAGQFNIQEHASTWQAREVVYNLAGQVISSSSDAVPHKEIVITFTPNTNVIGTEFYTSNQDYRQPYTIYPVVGLVLDALWDSTPYKDGYNDWPYRVIRHLVSTGILVRYGLITLCDGSPLPQIEYSTYVDTDGQTYTNHLAPPVILDHREPFWSFEPLFSNYTPQVGVTTTDAYMHNLPANWDFVVVPLNSYVGTSVYGMLEWESTSTPPPLTWTQFSRRGYNDLKVIYGIPSEDNPFMAKDVPYYKVYPVGGNSFADEAESVVLGGASAPQSNAGTLKRHVLVAYYRLDKLNAIRMVMPPFYAPNGLMAYLQDRAGIPPSIMDMEPICQYMNRPIYQGKYGTIPMPLCESSGELLGIPLVASSQNPFSVDLARILPEVPYRALQDDKPVSPQALVGRPLNVDEIVVAVAIAKKQNRLMVNIARRCVKGGQVVSCNSNETGFVEMPLAQWLSVNPNLPSIVDLDDAIPVQGTFYLHPQWPLSYGMLLLDDTPWEASVSFEELDGTGPPDAYCFAGTPSLLAITFVAIDNEVVAYELGVRFGIQEGVWAYPSAIFPIQVAY